MLLFFTSVSGIKVITFLSDALANMFSHSAGCLFILLMVFLCCANSFQFGVVPCVYFYFVSLAWGDISNKMSQQCLRFYYLGFLLGFLWFSGLIFKSLIHFEFILVCSVRRWYNLTFLHVSIQFPQHHLLNKLSLAHCMCLLPLQNTNWL